MYVLFRTIFLFIFRYHFVGVILPTSSKSLVAAGPEQREPVFASLVCRTEILGISSITCDFPTIGYACAIAIGKVFITLLSNYFFSFASYKWSNANE